jgi:hypothetical protein
MSWEAISAETYDDNHRELSEERKTELQQSRSVDYGFFRLLDSDSSKVEEDSEAEVDLEATESDATAVPKDSSRPGRSSDDQSNPPRARRGRGRPLIQGSENDSAEVTRIPNFDLCSYLSF